MLKPAVPVPPVASTVPAIRATVTRPAAAPRKTQKARPARTAEKAAPTGAKVRKTRKVRAAATRTPGRKSARRATRKTAKARPPKQHPRFVKVRELDPYAMCGPGTSVARLFRVDERVNGSAATHLVFYDRHGWYCEHGKTCPAVHDARKLR